jgi:UDP-N-acetylmuramoylalanine--D-glutamate ligase
MRKGRQVASIDLRSIRGLPGSHNHQNACAAYAAVRCLGLAPRLIEDAFATFKGLPHRSQVVGEVAGVLYVNDSKATNVDSAAKALAAFDSIRWIVGGQVKEGGLGALAPYLSRVAKAYVIGRQARDIALQLGGCELAVCETMAAAVAQAAADAAPGDTVLLAPAAASFDQYDNFEERGADFMAEVARVSSGHVAGD